MTYRQRPEAPRWVDYKQWSCPRHVPAAIYPAALEKCAMGCQHMMRPDGEFRPPPAPVKVAPVKPDPVWVTPAVWVAPEKVVTERGVVVVLAPEAWREFSDLELTALAEQPLDDLRKYASHVLRIPGASKIRGGKPALVARITQHWQTP